VDEIRAEGGEATALTAKVADFDQVKAVADHAAQEYGRLDTWVHLSAVSIFAKFEEISPEEFKRIVEVDLLGQAYGAMAALPHIKREGRGALIHVSSILARRSVPLQSPYCASKRGIEGFLESLRVELRHDGWPISVTNVMPASVNTPFWNKARTKMGVKPMGFPPIYQPSVVADAIVYAAAHPTRDIVAGGAGKGMLLGQRLSPRLMDAVMARAGIKAQQTDEPRPEGTPDALFGTLDGQDRSEGDFRKVTRSRSLSTWLDTHPVAKRGLAVGAVLAALAAVGARS
jgi:NAD(P)-dependent dehydrogenase (short-subunit alcohol dehydrogenase family)